MSDVFTDLEQSVREALPEEAGTPFLLLRAFADFPARPGIGLLMAELAELMNRQYRRTYWEAGDPIRVEFLKYETVPRIAAQTGVPRRTLYHFLNGEARSVNVRQILDRELHRQADLRRHHSHKVWDTIGRVAAAEVVRVACAHPDGSTGQWNRLLGEFLPAHPLDPLERFWVVAAASVDAELRPLLQATAGGRLPIGLPANVFNQPALRQLTGRAQFPSLSDLLECVLEWRASVLFVMQNLENMDDQVAEEGGAE